MPPTPVAAPLMRFDIAGMVVALDLERAGPAVAYIDDAGVFTRSLNHALALGRQTLQMHAARFVGAMFAPHHAVNAQLGEGRDASQCRQNPLVFLRGNAVLCQQLRGHRDRIGNDCRRGSSHHDCLHCRMGFKVGFRRIENKALSGPIRFRPRHNAGNVPSAPASISPLALTPLISLFLDISREPSQVLSPGDLLKSSRRPAPLAATPLPMRYFSYIPTSRDGGTGRRSGLKIRRPLRSWGFDPPSRHQQNKELKIELASPERRGQNRLVAVLMAVGCDDGLY